MTRRYDCPNGCGTYQRLSRHWSSGVCDFPALEKSQRETIEGLLLAGAAIAGNGPNKHLVVGTVHEPLAEWIGARLGWLTHSVREREDDSDADRRVEYRVRTHAHSTLSRYASWTEEPRRPPEGYKLTPPVAQTWYALAGGLQWHGDYDSQRTATFSALHDDRAEWILDVLERAGFDPTRAGKRVQLPPTDTRAWLTWIGVAVPGVVYKWAETRESYTAIRDALDNPRVEYTATDCLRALREVADELGHSPGFDEYDEIGKSPKALTINQRCGTWNEAKRLAGLDVRQPGGREPIYTDENLLDSLREIADELGYAPTYDEYKERRKSPGAQIIQQRFEQWANALVAAGLVDDSHDGYLPRDPDQR